MISAAAAYLSGIRSSHTSVLKVTAYKDGVLQGELPVVSATLNLDGTSDVIRVATVEAAIDDEGTATRDAVESLSVENGTIQIEHGVAFGETLIAPLVTIATLRVESIEESLSGATRTYKAYDRSLLLQEHLLPTPRPMNDTYVNLITTLVNETLPGETVTIEGGIDTALAPSAGKSMNRGDNRLSRIQEFAEALGAWFVCDPDGSFRLAVWPETGTSVWDLDAGTEGVLVNAEYAYSRREQYNAVGIDFTPASGSQWSGFVYMWDNDVASPTYYDGTFGKRNIFFSEEYDHLPTQTEAEDVARRKLYEYSGAARSVEVTALYNPLLVPGDRVTVKLDDGDTETHFIESLTFQFGKTAAMKVTGRLDRAPGSFGLQVG